MELQCLRGFSSILSADGQIEKNVLFQSFMDNTSDTIVVMDLNGSVLAVNRAFELLHGWTNDEVIGKILPMTPPYLMEEAKVLHRKVVAGEKVNGYETCNLRKDGSLIHVSVTIS
ncbi:MAG: PAS domain S-box protein, partial [Bacilli bacterium]